MSIVRSDVQVSEAKWECVYVYGLRKEGMFTRGYSWVYTLCLGSIIPSGYAQVLD